MTVLELFKSIDADKFAEEYLKYTGICDNVFFDDNVPLEEKTLTISLAFRRIKDCFLRIKDNTIPKANEKGWIIFTMPESENGQLYSFTVNKNDILEYCEAEDNLPTRYGYELDSIEDILGYTVSEASRYLVDDDAKFAASIFHEITFFGYYPELRNDKISEITNELNEAINDIKSGDIRLSSVEGSLLFEDSRRDFEKEFDVNKHSIGNDIWMRVFALLVKQERIYTNRGLSAEVS